MDGWSQTWILNQKLLGLLRMAMTRGGEDVRPLGTHKRTHLSRVPKALIPPPWSDLMAWEVAELARNTLAWWHPSWHECAQSGPGGPKTKQMHSRWNEYSQSGTSAPEVWMSWLRPHKHPYPIKNESTWPKVGVSYTSWGKTRVIWDCTTDHTEVKHTRWEHIRMMGAVAWVFALNLWLSRVLWAKTIVRVVGQPNGVDSRAFPSHARGVLEWGECLSLYSLGTWLRNKGGLLLYFGSRPWFKLICKETL